MAACGEHAHAAGSGPRRCMPRVADVMARGTLPFFWFFEIRFRSRSARAAVWSSTAACWLKVKRTWACRRGAGAAAHQVLSAARQLKLLQCTTAAAATSADTVYVCST